MEGHYACYPTFSKTKWFWKGGNFQVHHRRINQFRGRSRGGFWKSARAAQFFGRTAAGHLAVTCEIGILRQSRGDHSSEHSAGVDAKHGDRNGDGQLEVV